MPWPGPQTTPVMLMKVEPELMAMQSSPIKILLIKKIVKEKMQIPIRNKY